MLVPFPPLIKLSTFPTVVLIDLWLIHGSWVQSLFLGEIHLNLLSRSLSYS